MQKALYTITAALVSAAAIVFLVSAFDDHKRKPSNFDRSMERLNKTLEKTSGY